MPPKHMQKYGETIAGVENYQVGRSEPIPALA